MLLALSGVSPQPPSSFCVSISQAMPAPTVRSTSGTATPASSAVASAAIAVAVASALLDKCPSQCPAATRRSSRGRAARCREAGEKSGSETEVSKREQPVIRIFAVEHLVGPAPVKAAGAGPQRIDEVEARLAQRRKIDVECRKRMQSRRRRKKIRKRRTRSCEETAVRVAAGEQPTSYCGI